MICASYKENGEVRACYPRSIMFKWNESHIGQRFKDKWNFAPGKSKDVEYTVRECQCELPSVGKTDD